MSFIRAHNGLRINLDHVARVEPNPEQSDTYRLFGSLSIGYLGVVDAEELEALDPVIPARPGDSILVLRETNELIGPAEFYTYRLPVIGWRLTPAWVMPVVPGHTILDGLDWALPMNTGHGATHLYQAPFAGTEYYTWDELLAEWRDYRQGQRAVMEEAFAYRTPDDLLREEQLAFEFDYHDADDDE